MNVRNCASCNCDISQRGSLGNSSLYNPGPNSFILCEECYFTEDDLINSTGTNVHPDKLKLYTLNQPEGAN